MSYIKYLFMALIMAMPLTALADHINTQVPDTDTIADDQLTGYYDLRDRKTYIQITNDGNESGDTVLIHVQIFQHDRDCDEINFFDELTINDTVVYDLDNLVRNDGSAVPASLLDDSYGYVVISTDDGSGSNGDDSIIGNFRIIDNAGYEYRTNLVGTGSDIEQEFGDAPNEQFILNFNTINGANQADVVGYAFHDVSDSTVMNIDRGFEADVFAFDMDEEPLSCDRANFACGGVMNYGILENYPNSRSGPLLCEGGELANPQGGFVSLENIDFPATATDPEGDPGDNNDEMMVGFIGINNGNSTGSMDIWLYGDGFSEDE